MMAYRCLVVHQLSSATRLRVSEQCCLFYLQCGTTRLKVMDIAHAAGVSERTFYRYFTVKADSVAPVFDWMTQTMNAAVLAHPPTQLRDVVIDAFEAMFTSRITGRAQEFFPLIFADEEMWALFLRKVHDGETSLAPLLADLLGLPVGHDRARAAAAAIASSTRIALERLSTEGTGVTVEFTKVLDAFGPWVLTPLRAGSTASGTTSASGSTS